MKSYKKLFRQAKAKELASVDSQGVLGTEGKLIIDQTNAMQQYFVCVTSVMWSTDVWVYKPL